MSFIDIAKDIFNSVIKRTKNSITKKRQIPAQIDFTYPDTIDTRITRGLWHNALQGYKLGAQLCYNPISVPLSFMGVPTFFLPDSNVPDYDFWVERFLFYNNALIKDKQNIQLLCHRDGTVGVYPWFDSKDGRVKLRWILPEDIKKIITDIETDEIKAIITEVRIQYYENNIDTYRIFDQKIIYTQSTIEIRRTGDIPVGLRTNIIRNNPTGLPIFFRNNCEPREFDGHSDYERIVPHIYAYSQINEKAHQYVNNLGPKLVQAGDNVDSWLRNNGFINNQGIPDVGEVEIQTVDFIFNKLEKEKSEFIIPSGLVDNHLLLLKLDFWNIVQTSGIPEICWGLKTEGNHASAQEQMGILLSFVSGKQIQADNPYYDLLNKIIKLESIANTKKIPIDVGLSWNDLDVMTKVEKSEMFKNFADGISKLSESAGIDLQTIHNFLIELTKGKVETDYKTFEKQVKEYGTIKSYLEQEYIDIRETNSTDKTKTEKGSNGVKSKS